MVLCIVASPPVYAVEDATAVNYNVAYQMLKSLINYSPSRNSAKVSDHNSRG